jgi:hypothetical protein
MFPAAAGNIYACAGNVFDITGKEKAPAGNTIAVTGKDNVYAGTVFVVAGKKYAGLTLCILLHAHRGGN